MNTPITLYALIEQYVSPEVRNLPEAIDSIIDTEDRIRGLIRSVLLEYKDTHLGLEGIRILNELDERFSKL